MIKTATQLKDLIRNLSKKKSANAQILMRNYMMERFLKRISISSRRVTLLCNQGRIEGAVKRGLMWFIPQDTPKPIDPRKLRKMNEN